MCDGVLNTAIIYICNTTDFDPLQPGVAFLYHLKTSEDIKVFLFFQGHRKAAAGCNGLKE